MDAYPIMSAVSAVLVGVGFPVLGYIVQRRDKESDELKQEVSGLRDQLQEARLEAKDRDRQVAVLETQIKAIDNTVTRGEFERAFTELAKDISEIKRFVMPAPSPSPGRYGGSRFGSSDSIHSPPKDPKR